MRNILTLVFSLLLLTSLYAQKGKTENELQEKLASGSLPISFGKSDAIFMEMLASGNDKENYDSESLTNQSKYDVAADVQDSINLVAFLRAAELDDYISGNVSTWRGVSLDSDGKVIAFNSSITRSWSIGEIPQELFNLANLRYLDISGLGFTGAIPNEFGNLTSLISLDLNRNNLSGGIPTEISNLKNLSSLELQFNELSGEINGELFDLPNLITLDLSYNQLTGNIPTGIGNLINLSNLYLNDNSFSGEIPSEIGHLTNLQELYLYDNNFTGDVPIEFGSLINLTELFLHNNSLEKLPDLSTLTNLTSCLLFNNNFTFSDLENAKINSTYYSYSPQADVTIARTDHNEQTILSVSLLGINNNYTWYNIQDSLAGEKNDTLIVDSNNIDDVYYCRIKNSSFPDLVLKSNYEKFGNPDLTNGVVTSEYNALIKFYEKTDGEYWKTDTNWLSSEPVENWHGISVDAVHVSEISLRGNNLRNQIPKEISELKFLKELFLYENNLSGMLPKEICELSNLEVLNLYKNNFYGNIPKEIGNLTNLKEVTFSFNNFNGDIPDEICNLIKLKYLYLYDNKLSGSIPTQIGNLQDLDVLSLARNQLLGSIPVSIGNLIKLRHIWLFDNQLSGEIPKEIGNLTKLENLYLNNNKLSGEIPEEIGNLINLIWLSLDMNSLIGNVPIGINSLTNLEGIKLNDNNLDSLPNLIDLRLKLFRMQNNFFDFKDFENANLWMGSSYYVDPHVYFPQRKVGSTNKYFPNETDTIELTITVGGSANTYQWYQDTTEITGATDSTYTIFNYNSINDKGVYICKIKDSNFPKLTLVTNNNYVGVYPIDAIANPIEGGSITGLGAYDIGDTISLEANPSGNYDFINWTENGNEVSSDTLYSFVLDKSRNLVANFSLKSFEISASVNDNERGTVIGQGIYELGNIAMLTATSNPGFEFDNWTEDGENISNDSILFFIVDTARTLVANFNSPVNIDKLSVKNSFLKIYPIPADDNFINVEYKDSKIENKNLTLIICDYMGRIVQNYNFNSSPKQINISQLKGGIYFVLLQNENSIIETKKIIIK